VRAKFSRIVVDRHGRATLPVKQVAQGEGSTASLSKVDHVARLLVGMIRRVA